MQKCYCLFQVWQRDVVNANPPVWFDTPQDMTQIRKSANWAKLDDGSWWVTGGVWFNENGDKVKIF